MSKTRNKFSPEVRERAARIVDEHRADYGSQWAAMTSCAAITTMACRLGRLGWGRSLTASIDHSVSVGSDCQALSVLIDCGNHLAREGQMRLFLVPKPVKPLDGFLCRRNDEVRGQPRLVGDRLQFAVGEGPPFA